MKHIRTFEYINVNAKNLKIGDYVIMGTFDRDELLKFFNENIGRIEEIFINNINVKYDTTPKGYEEEFLDNTRWFPTNLLRYSSENREDLEIILSLKKYNL